MEIYAEEFAHPTQASRVRLRVFQQPEGGFLVTEEWVGTATVVKTLGLFDARQPALEKAAARASELARQRFAPVGRA